MQLAICYTKPGTTLTFWLNRFHAGGFIWSLVRTKVEETDYAQRWNQPALRFASQTAAVEFIVDHLGGNADARIATVAD